MTGTEPVRHVVVLDCNIYLDVAALVGPPFRWAEFNRLTATLARTPIPHPDDRVYDSLRAIAVSTSGFLAGDEVMEMWSSAHIERLVAAKARQATAPDREGLCGLGWSDTDGDDLVDLLVNQIVQMSGGGRLEHHRPEGNPPLDHEDGMVFGACHLLAAEDPLARIYCVTRDRGFLAAHREGRLASHTTVLTPSQFVVLVRRARASYSIRGMKPLRHP